jgi:lipopolysaccharide transport system permease protein
MSHLRNYLAERETPASPTITIAPRRGLAVVDVRELWSYRELLYFLIWRDLKVRYKQTLFGALWAVLQPVLLMVVFSLFLGRISGIGSPGIPYPLFVFVALVPWTLFAQSLIAASNSLVGAASLIQKVYFPRLLLPIGSVGSYLLDFGIGIVVLVGLMVALGVLPSVTSLWVLPLTGLTLAVAVGVGIWLAAINVRYRDVRYAVPFLVQIWLFASPVAYSIDLVPSGWKTIYHLNPLVGVIEGFRWALLDRSQPPVEGIALSIAVASVVLSSGLLYFRRVERTFADVI